MSGQASPSTLIGDNDLIKTVQDDPDDDRMRELKYHALGVIGAVVLLAQRFPGKGGVRLRRKLLEMVPRLRGDPGQPLHAGQGHVLPGSDNGGAEAMTGELDDAGRWARPLACELT